MTDRVADRMTDRVTDGVIDGMIGRPGEAEGTDEQARRWKRQTWIARGFCRGWQERLPKRWRLCLRLTACCCCFTMSKD